MKPWPAIIGIALSPFVGLFLIAFFARPASNWIALYFPDCWLKRLLLYRWR